MRCYISNVCLLSSPVSNGQPANQASIHIGEDETRTHLAARVHCNSGCYPICANILYRGLEPLQYHTELESNQNTNPFLPLGCLRDSNPEYSLHRRTCYRYTINTMFGDTGNRTPMTRSTILHNSRYIISPLFSKHYFCLQNFYVIFLLLFFS